MTDTESKRPIWLTLALTILPLWLLVSAGLALWFGMHREKQQASEQVHRYAQDMSAPRIADDLRKLIEIIGERNPSSEIAAENLTRAASMIEGILGPINAGYQVQRIPGPAAWPLLHVTLNGKDTNAPAVWVITSYDSRPGSPGADANASGVAATIAAAQTIANDAPKATVHFVFLPHANDPESPILETATRLQNLIKSPAAVLCVEAMGADSPLWISSRDANNPVFNHLNDLGTVHGAEVICLSDDSDLSSILFEMNISATRVATRPMVPTSDPDRTTPPADHMAASSGRLVELIRRCASIANLAK